MAGSNPCNAAISSTAEIIFGCIEGSGTVPKTANKEQEAPVEQTDEQKVALEGAATKAHNEALANLDAAKQALQEAGQSGDIDQMVEWAGKVKAAEGLVAKTQRAVADAEFNRFSEQRLAASVALKGAVEQFLDELNVASIYPLGIRTVSVSFNEDFSANVSIGTVKAPSQANANAKTSPKRTDATNPRSNWTFNGRSYSSRELLETFGGEKGILAVERTQKDGPNGYGNKLTKTGQPATNPGFDSEVKALAKRMGWDGGDERLLTKEPEAE